jgi:hypothetical protein
VTPAEQQARERALHVETETGTRMVPMLVSCACIVETAYGLTVLTPGWHVLRPEVAAKMLEGERLRREWELYDRQQAAARAAAAAKRAEPQIAATVDAWRKRAFELWPHLTKLRLTVEIERKLAVAAMRQKGLIYAEIGKRLAVSTSRARQLAIGGLRVLESKAAQRAKRMMFVPGVPLATEDADEVDYGFQEWTPAAQRAEFVTQMPRG